MRREFDHGRRSLGSIVHAHLALAILAGSVLIAPEVDAQTPIEAGYRDFNFGTVVNDTPTGEKPQSKVWWNDGSWWGILWDPTSSRYEIHKLNTSTQAWTSTNVAADTRSSAKGDALWDGTRLYLAFHVFSNGSQNVSPSQAAQLYRYSYDAGTDQYSLDLGFPVTINSSNSETLVLAKDGTGQLWITWIQSGDVMVNHSVGNDLTWGTPYRLPIQGNDADGDDISSVFSLPGRIGIFWTNQEDEADYFAAHLDGAADNVWQPRETALSDGSLSVADDHISMALDVSGNLYVATKTSLNSTGQPLIYLLRRTPSAVWTRYVLGLVENDHTRPIVQVDEGGTIYVLMASPLGGRERIYMKTSSTSNISFPGGLGTPFISSLSDNTIRNPSGTKQLLTAASDMLVIASDQGTDRYFHNLLAIGGSGPAIASFVPASGVPGNQVTISGSGFTGATSVTFNGVNAPGFIVDSANQIRVNVPATATTGPIRVVTPQGTAVSSANFVIEAAPTIASFTPGSGPPGIEVTVTGTSFVGTTDVRFNGLSTSFTVDGDTQLRANVPGGATTGSISITNGVGTGTSSSSFVVTAPPPVVTFTAVHDARVESGNPTSNYGTGSGNTTLLRVRAGPEIDSYIKFNVSGLSGPVVSAKLRLFCIDDSPDGGRVYATSNNYLGTSTPWTETGIIWNNAPGVGGTILDHKNNVAVNAWVEFDVTPAITGNGTFSLGLTSGLSNIAGYQSKEWANPPQLVVSTAAGSPTIASFTPSSGPPGTVVTITGGNFGTTSAVAFNGVTAAFIIDNNTELRATVPSAASSGPISITNAIGTTASAAIFTVTPPTITGFTPDSGPIGATITITGTQFATVSVVRFAGTAASFVIDSPTQIRATVPVGAASGPISVVNPAGSASSATSFTVILPPTVASFSPASGPPGAQVAITGTQFSIATAVTFNGASASFVIDSPTQLRATVPAGASTGLIGVTNLAGSATSPTAFTVLPSGAPTIADFAPTSGPVGTVVSITGTQFTGTTTVKFNGVASAFTVVGPTQISATVPAGATPGPIAVTNQVGTTSSATDFVVTIPQTTFLPTADARVESANPTSNFGSGAGTRPLLRVRTGPAINSYLKFSVSGLVGPPTQARVRLFCQDESTIGGTIYLVSNDYAGTSTPWTESGLIWNNAPAIGGAALDAKGAVAIGQWVEFDVTPAITGDGIYSFGLTSSTGNIAGYTSRESTTPPELVIGDGAVASLSAGGGSTPVQRAASSDLVIDAESVATIALGPIRPNPFRGEMSFRVDLPRSDRVRLVVFDLMGRRVRTLVEGILDAGAHEFSWDARDDGGARLEAGLYLIQLDTPGFTTRRKAVLAR